ncbi:MAG: hypothetical protein LWW85_04955 [Marinilabiliales bacterium]|nr:hypothetical protein [Marinilabiliales bacterium]
MPFFRKWLLFLFFIPSLTVAAASGKGIVIASESDQLELFNADSLKVLAFADSITADFNRVILHLGQGYAFRTGGIHATEKSRTNLRLFADRLREKKIPLTLWFLDSFGKEAFEEIYQNYKPISDENVRVLDSLQIPYDGIAVDLEWFNLNNGKNHARFEEILSYLHDRLKGEKRLYFFAPLQESRQENERRGFHISKLLRSANAPLAMFYPAESGFHVNRNEVLPNFGKERIEHLKQHFRKQKWEVILGLGEKWLCQFHHDLTEVESLKSPPILQPDKLKLETSRTDEYWQTETYAVVSPQLVNFEDGTSRMAKPGDRLLHFTIRATVAEADYYCYEYFHLRANHLLHSTVNETQ